MWKIVELLEVAKIKEDNGKISFQINNKKYTSEIDYSLLPAQRISKIIWIDVFTLRIGSKYILSVSRDDFAKVK